MHRAKKEERRSSTSPEGESSVVRNGIATPSTSITHQSEKFESKQTAKHDHFLQLPHCVIDSDLPGASRLGFIEFLRHYGRLGTFVGSIRKLCKILRMARSTVTRMIGEWCQAGWVKRASKPKEYEDGEVMSLIILSDAIWQQNSDRYKKTEETGSEMHQGGSNLSQGGTKVNQSGSNVGHNGSKESHSGSSLGQTGTPRTLKTGGNIGNIESKIDSKMEGNMGREYSASPQQQPITEPLPSLPPSSSFSEKDLTWETITPNTSHCWEAILAIGEHYLGRGKCSQKDAEALCSKTQTYAGLVGAHAARQQIITNITFMLYSDAPSNWYCEKRGQVTLRAAATYHEDYTRKAQESDWVPPADKLPSWFGADEISSPQESTEAGMTQRDAEVLRTHIIAHYPGMKTCYGHLPGDRYVVSVWLGEADAWLDFSSMQEWQSRSAYEPHWTWALEVYEQEARAA